MLFIHTGSQIQVIFCENIHMILKGVVYESTTQRSKARQSPRLTLFSRYDAHKEK